MANVSKLKLYDDITDIISPKINILASLYGSVCASPPPLGLYKLKKVQD